MEIKDLLYGVLTKTLNMTDEEVSALLYTDAEDSEELVLKDDALKLVLDADVSRVDKIRKAVKPDPERLKNEYKRGAKETMEGFENDVRDYFKADIDAKGLDLIKAIHNEATKSKKSLTDDDVKKHPLYLELEKNRIPKEEYETLKTEFDDFKSNQAKNERLSIIKKDVMSHFNTLNAIQSKNPQVATTRLNDFLSKFENYDYEVAEDGNHLIMKNGSRLEDEHGNPVKFKDFVGSTASLNYDFAESDNKGNAGNKNSNDDGGAHIEVPKSEAEYLKKMAEETDPAKKVKIYEAFKAANN